jgi:TatA/E family protein of Tat protein translocase
MFIGHWEVLLVAFVAMLLFGHRLPNVMGSLGEAVRSFRDAFSAKDDCHSDGEPSLHG